MKLSHFISHLNTLLAMHGDLEVVHDDGYGHLHEAKNVSAVVAPTIRHPDPEVSEDSRIRADKLIKERPGHGGTRGMFIEPYQSIAIASPTRPMVVLQSRG